MTCTGALWENREPGENPGRTRHCMGERGTGATGLNREGVPGDETESGDLPVR